MLSLCALCIGFALDLILGDPPSSYHPVAKIGQLIAGLEKTLRQLLPKTDLWEKIAGGILWYVVVNISVCTPIIILHICRSIAPWLSLAAESIMCWQILATKSLRVESMKVHTALLSGDLEASRHAVSMIVGRDTQKLTAQDVARATVETVAENTSDGVVAPLLFMALGGAPMGFFYKAVNTMDSMLGYTEMPYKNIGLIPARMDDIMNFIPARISAFLMLAAGAVLQMNTANGWKIFKRDRYNHASPNSAQTESVCAGLMGLRLGGDAWYHGVLHKKQYIGDPLREITPQDIPDSCRLMYMTAALAALLAAVVKLLILVVV